MSKSATIYLLSEDQKLKDWTELFKNNLSMIFNQFFASKEPIEVQSFDGKLSNAGNHIFLLTGNEKFPKLEVAHENLYQIHLAPIKYSSIPDYLHQAPMFEFYDVDMVTNESTWTDLDVSAGNSWEKLLDITKNIFNIYTKDKETIYLAKSSLNQSSNRDLLKRDLLNQGFNVIPEHPLNDSSTDVFEKQINLFAAQSSISIHTYGNDINQASSENVEIVDFQNKVCSKIENNNLQRFIWLPTNVRLDKVNEEKISILKKDLELLNGAELVEAPLELFKSLIYQKVEKLKNLNKNKKSGLYFIYDNKENQDIKNIKAEIQKNNLDVLMVNNLEDHPLLSHKNNLSNSDGIIIYYDGSNSNWIDNILNDIIKAPKYRNNKEINSIGIVSSSELILKQELESYKLEKIDIADQTQLETFIQNINK